MPWTRNDQLAYLLGLPWTVLVSRDQGGDFIARVAELPFLVATGDNEKAIAIDLYDALESALDAHLEHGDQLTLPHDARPPWERGVEPTVSAITRTVVRLQIKKAARWGEPTASTDAQSFNFSVA